MKLLYILLVLMLLGGCVWAEEIKWHDLEAWIKYDDNLRRKIAFEIINNNGYVDWGWFLDYQENLNEECAKYTIHCECGQDFPAIPDKRTWREFCMLESWMTTCPYCKTKYDAWYDKDFPVGEWATIEDRLVETEYKYFGFRYKKTKTYCNDKNCRLHYVEHTDMGKNSCTSEKKKEYLKKYK